MRMLPITCGGEFARGLEAGRDAALALANAVQSDRRFVMPFSPQLDIIVWAIRSRTATESSQHVRRLFEAAGRHDLHLALATLPCTMFAGTAPVAEWDADDLICLACVMKPEHGEWMPEIVRRLRLAANECAIQTV